MFKCNKNTLFAALAFLTLSFCAHAAPIVTYQCEATASKHEGEDINPDKSQDEGSPVIMLTTDGSSHIEITLETKEGGSWYELTSVRNKLLDAVFGLAYGEREFVNRDKAITLRVSASLLNTRRFFNHGSVILSAGIYTMGGSCREVHRE